MPSTKLIFNADEVERLRTKIGQVSQDTNLLYMQLKGQANNWGGIPLGQDLVQAQVLINELTVEAEKLEDIIRQAVKGVQGLQEENKRQASQLTQQFSLFTGMFGSFGGSGSQGRFSVPPFAQKAATKLISTIATLMGRDELDKDPAVEKLRDILQKSGFGTIEGIAAQSKLNDIYEARNLIAKAQTAYEVYQAFGNKPQMNAMHKLAEDARKKLESLGVDKVQYEAGKNLSAHFKQPAVKACDYDPSITTSNVSLVQNETYLLLLRMAMEPGDQGDLAKSQLAGKRLEIKEASADLDDKGVFDFSEYDKKLIGNTWVLSKNGVTDQRAAQASIAYQKAVQNGEIKIKQESLGVDVIQEQTKAAIAGYNYWTGEKLSKIQAYAIIISGIMYNFQGISGYRGKINKNLKLPYGSVRIPRPSVKEPVTGIPEIPPPKSIKPLEQVVEGTGKVQTGGKSDIFDPDEYLRNLDKADEMYDTFRSSTTDVASITRNTGMKETRVQRIREHLFIKEHIKDHGVGRFDADYDIAQAWERLQKGTYKQSDIDLLNHELFESRFEGIFKTNYRTAHDKTLESGRPWNP
ncbi:hypothetical protein [Paenibacillus sp. HW567]|uniref:hypothetical protein n=1 Tax=Paenibacillus sp. HW567 TaxID=1034769 RepID=UPI0003706959|nr:hypothetical protein [Paenibacillus sp. HW567]